MTQTKLKFIWKVKTGEYQNGESLYINKICVGGYSWNGAMSRDEPQEYKLAHSYIASCYLPGFIDRRVYAPTTEEIKAHIEKMVTNWFNEALREV
jgi:hypothetical protein